MPESESPKSKLDPISAFWAPPLGGSAIWSILAGKESDEAKVFDWTWGASAEGAALKRPSPNGSSKGYNK